MNILEYSDKYLDQYSIIRKKLWDKESVFEHKSQIKENIKSNNNITFLVIDDFDNCIAFAEASLRHDYVNGCSTSPVSFIEGIYVIPSVRLGGVGRKLIEKIIGWSKEKGCTEIASDADEKNIESHAMHEALGFEETERVVFFRRDI